MNNEHDYDPAAAIEAQKEYCRKRQIPQCAPEDGKCWGCHKNIYKKYGYTVQAAETRLITGCPFCAKSFLD